MDGAVQRRKLPPLSLLRALWKRRLLAGAVWLIGTAGAVAVVQILPAIYRAEAVIRVDHSEPATNPRARVQKRIYGPAQEWRQQALSYARLLEMVREFRSLPW